MNDDADPMTTETAEMFLRQRDEATADRDRWKGIAQQWYDGLEAQGAELADVTAECGRYREALETIRDNMYSRSDELRDAAREVLASEGRGKR